MSERELPCAAREDLNEGRNLSQSEGTGGGGQAQEVVGRGGGQAEVRWAQRVSLPSFWDSASVSPGRLARPAFRP